MVIKAENETIEPVEELEVIPGDLVGTEGEMPAAETEVSQESDSEDEVVVSIGDESPPPEEDEFEGKPAPQFVKDLRKKAREDGKRIRELEQAAAERDKQQVSRPADLGAKPTLESCDYDAESFSEKLEAWHERKREHEQEKSAKDKAQADADAEFQKRVQHHNKLKSELKVKDFDEAQANVESILSQPQMAMIVDAADNSAVLFYALGKNPGKAKELAAITNPVKYVYAVAKLETQLKVTPRKNAPAPERKVSGSAPVVSSDKHLQKLEEEADKSGDRSKVQAYKRSLKK